MPVGEVKPVPKYIAKPTMAGESAEDPNRGENPWVELRFAAHAHALDNYVTQSPCLLGAESGRSEEMKSCDHRFP